MGFYPNRKEVVLLIQLLFVLGIILHAKAYICEIGREKDDRNVWRWVLPYDDPCGCSKIIMGGMNTWTPIRPFKPTYVDSPLLSDDIGEIRKHYGLGCNAYWGDWEDWDICSTTCGNGSQSRRMQCVFPEFTYTPCGGEQPKETRFCNNDQCPFWSDWEDWNSCSETSCGNGTQERVRTCMDPDSIGDQCEGDQPSENQSCNNGRCPFWSDEWVDWNSCSTSCGNGTQERVRTCMDPDSISDQCEGDQPSENQSCNNGRCPFWSDWEDWNSCSETSCGNGTQERVRTCMDPDSIGDQCEGDQPSENQSCNNGRCPFWSDEWGDWNSCSTNCGNGTQERVKTCMNPDSIGDQCEGDQPSENQSCNNGRCPFWSDEWEDWNSCSITNCGNGTQERVRTCMDPDSIGDQCEGDQPSEDQSCNNGRCPFWSDEWGDWNSCSTNCGNGTQERVRTCMDPDSIGDQCEGGQPSENQSCNNGRCPFWSGWGAWSSCSSSCNNGTWERVRTCLDPDSIGVPCEGGQSDETLSCSNGRCPSWSEWGEWDSCSTSCGNGTQKRAKECLDPDSISGPCEGDKPSEYQNCYNGRCPVWGEWGASADCNSCITTCGSVTRSRVKECQNPDFPNSPCDGEQPIQFFEGSVDQCWGKNGNYCYYAKAGAYITYDGARAVCLAHHAVLTSVVSREEHNFLKELVRDLNVWFWIGLNDKETEGNWEWEDGTEFGFENWKPDQPDNAGGNEDCAHFLSRNEEDIFWNDKSCNHRISGYICKMRQPVEIPLGMEDRTINDEQISASSYYGDLRPWKGRLNNSKGHWAPPERDSAPWIQVTFTSAVTMTALQTQGAVSTWDNWVTHLQIQTGDSEGDLSYIVDGNNVPVTFAANSDRSTITTIVFPEPISGRIVRIKPTAWHERCMLRFEVLGYPQSLWSEWTAWSGDCATTCGTGTRHRTKKCVIPVACGDKQITQSRNCTQYKQHWGTNGDYCYYAKANADKTYGQARDVCMKHNAVLTSVRTIEERDFLTEFVRDFGVWFWIGLHKATEGNWEWEDGTTFGYLTNWGPDQPDNAGNDKDCVHFRTSGAWNDRQCNSSVPGYICKMRLRRPLGMEDMSISNTQITASSFYSSNGVNLQPWKGRLNNNNINGYWSTKEPDPNPWIQVAFASPVTMTALQTQCSVIDGAWVKHLQIQTGHSDSDLSYIVDENNKPVIFSANSDSTSISTIEFPEPVCARIVRIQPKDWQWRCALRFEVFGHQEC